MMHRRGEARRWRDATVGVGIRQRIGHDGRSKETIMKKRSEAMSVAAGVKGAMRSVREADLLRIQAGAGNAAIDFAIKPPR